MRRGWLCLTMLLLSAGPAAAQQDTTKIPPGVRLEVVYQTSARPKLAVRPLEAEPVLVAAAEQIRGILRRDLDYSDRFLMAELPAALQSGAVQYPALNDFSLVWLVAGRLVPGPAGGYALSLELHDVPFGSVKASRTFAIPDPASPNFRMAVHAASDEIVRWATGQPGMAASRILFARWGRSGAELLTVDSDGENLQRIAGSDEALYSPAWSPDASRVAYGVRSGAGTIRLLERSLATGETRVISDRTGNNYTPAYSPDGRRLAFAATQGRGQSIFDYDIAQRCCLRQLTRSPRDDLSPTYSPDGARMAFNSNRLGQPHVFIMPAEGGEAILLSPYVHGEPGYYTSPDWSPLDQQVTFHGRSRGAFQIMVGDAARPGAVIRQITAEGWNEDPSWAPDGRHIVFAGERPEGTGLFVIDTGTGRIRPLILGGRHLMPDWSPILVQASAVTAQTP